MFKQHKTHHSSWDQEATFLDAHMFDEDVPEDAEDYDEELVAAELIFSFSMGNKINKINNYCFFKQCKCKNFHYYSRPR
jgi:hypothetical protein